MQKGCLARLQDDIKSDGSRIEGCHKQWNSLQRTFSCGLENLVALGHDHTLRTNIRIAFNKERIRSKRPFLASTFGSHHIGLINYVAKKWNLILSTETTAEKILNSLTPRPELQVVESHEQIGLVSSEHVLTFGGLLTIKDEDELEDDILEMPLHELLSEDDVIHTLGIDPTSLLIPEGGTVHSPPQHVSTSHSLEAVLSNASITTSSNAVAVTIKASDRPHQLADQMIVSAVFRDCAQYSLEFFSAHRTSRSMKRFSYKPTSLASYQLPKMPMPTPTHL